MKKTHGFTLIELLIVITIIVLLATISVLMLSGFRTQQSLRLASGNLVTFLRDAQQKSVGQEGGVGWGVHFVHQPGGRDSYSLFSGPSFTSAISTVALPAGVEFASGYADAVFAKATGLPGAAAAIIMRLANNTAVTRTITINVQGTIEEQ